MVLSRYAVDDIDVGPYTCRRTWFSFPNYPCHSVSVHSLARFRRKSRPALPGAACRTATYDSRPLPSAWPSLVGMPWSSRVSSDRHAGYVGKKSYSPPLRGRRFPRSWGIVAVEVGVAPLTLRHRGA